MEFASSLEEQAAVEREIDAISHSIVDSGPLTVGFAPSLHQALDALQRQRKRSGRRV
jgi:hypothetical protein